MKNPIKVKLCGFYEPISLLAAIAYKPDFIGFVFHKNSPRNVDINQAQELAALVPSDISKVAVTINASLDFLQEIAKNLQPQYFQLHGSEDKEQIFAIKKNFPEVKIIKAFSINNQQDLQQSLDFIDIADIFLYDNNQAGSGKNFDWNLLKDFDDLLKKTTIIAKKLPVFDQKTAKNWQKPLNCSRQPNWFLSGGLNPQNVLEAIKTTHATMVDVSSSLERERGKKSPDLIAEFMKKVKNA